MKTMEKQTDSWLATKTGRKVNPSTMEANDVSIEDISWALSNLCRYNGHCDHFYSVAQHSVYVSQIVETLGGDPKKGLLHDATECYIGDMIRPVKHRDDMVAFRTMEDRVMEIIGQHFGIDGPLMNPKVKLADNIVLLTEKEQILTSSPPWGWGNDLPKADINITLMYPDQAYNFFMDKYNELFK